MGAYRIDTRYPCHKHVYIYISTLHNGAEWNTHSRVFYPEEDEDEFGDKIAGGLVAINYGGALIGTLNSKKCIFFFSLFCVKARLLLLQGPQLLDASD